MADLYINGSWTGAADGGTRDVLDPADGSVLAHVDEAGKSDVDDAVGAARRAFDDGPWRTTTAGERATALRAIVDGLRTNREDLARIESLDTGKTIAEAETDVDDITAVFDYYADTAGKDEGRVVDTGVKGAISRIVYEPIGVCALIAPWNYPLLQMSWKLAPALAAGNTCVIKPSEVTPLATIELVRIIAATGLPAGVLNLLLGDGAGTGAPMTEHPGVDMVSFTGGLETGKRIMATCAADVKNVALELGGKNPNVVFDDADFDSAVDYALNAVFFHSGQVCSAGARLIIQENLHDRFVDELARRAARIKLGRGQDEGVEVGPLVSEAHRAKVERYIQTAKDEGALLRCGGKRPDDPALADGFFLEPTIFDRCDRTMTIVREEVFGPVLSVETFVSEDEAVFLANDTEFGLAGAVWTADAGRGQRVAQRLRHGTVWINDYHPYVPQAEWGGFGKSGIGRELGPTGLEEYRESKHIWQNTDPAPMRWFNRQEQ
ncbi:aldehyde dehydrogenase family protein [Glycomyces buryatensis]|uniref:Aldehyde dehydrogenase family protein n=1 Tax=Glycomyces buryatensis TaxID=2570927 RepID=A0A4S8Q944_9ACTN|nr:aldehyde dehydrogenase family protein [Glycomyces buryatensis]THV40838.1 aldehyde dehydrogenase family protein [Glycomyces buryatensis]